MMISYSLIHDDNNLYFDPQESRVVLFIVLGTGTGTGTIVVYGPKNPNQTKSHEFACRKLRHLERVDIIFILTTQIQKRSFHLFSVLFSLHITFICTIAH